MSNMNKIMGKTAELGKLIAENPELPVILMVDGNVYDLDVSQYTLSSIWSSHIGKVCEYNEKIFDDEDDLRDEVADIMWDEYKDEDNYEELIEHEADKVKWLDCIVVYTEPESFRFFEKGEESA